MLSVHAKNMAVIILKSKMANSQYLLATMDMPPSIKSIHSTIVKQLAEVITYLEEQANG